MLRITTQVQRYNPTRRGVAWKTLKRWMGHLESRGEMLRISRPVDVVYEAGAIADLLVKNNGPAVLFEKPRLAAGRISKIPLVMHRFGSNARTLRALGASHETEVGDRMVAMMKPEIGEFMKKMNKEMNSRETSFVVREIDGGGDVAWAQWTAKTPNGDVEGCGLYKVKNGMMTYYKDYMNAPKDN